MQIEFFNQLLQQKYPKAEAYVPEKFGTNDRAHSVAIIYQPGGKVYTYKGTIVSVADRLNLVPEIDINVESQKVVEELKQGQTPVTFIQCHDTIVHFLNMPGKTVEFKNRRKNEFDQEVGEVVIVENRWV